MNLGGASDRPALSEIWEDVQGMLNGKQIQRKSYTTQSAVKVLGGKILETPLVLIAMAALPVGLLAWYSRA